MMMILRRSRWAEGGVLGAMEPGALFVDHTTVSANMARRLAEAAPEGIGFVDAPVSRRAGGRGERQAGDHVRRHRAAISPAAEPVMQSYASAIVHVGPAGAGQTAKMANQMCIAGVLAGLSEAVRLAEAAGLDLDKIYEAISGGAAQSWQMDNRWPTMAAGTSSISASRSTGCARIWAMRWTKPRRLGLAAPVTALVDQFYADVQAAGGGRKDTSALITRLPRRVPERRMMMLTACLRFRALAATSLLALAAPALADTLVDNVDGMTIDDDGDVLRFTGMVFDDDGKVTQVLERGDKRPQVDYRLDGEGQVMIPGMIDAHVHVMGQSALPR